jgi:hypothetical protein
MDIRHDDGMAMMMAMAATAPDERARGCPRPGDFFGGGHRGELSRPGCRCVCGRSGRGARPGRSGCGGELECCVERNCAIDIRRRRAWRHARAGRWIDDRSRAGPQHGRLRQNPAVRRCRHGCGHGAASVGAEQSAMAAVRYGRLKDLLPNESIDSPYYVSVLVGDDPVGNGCAAARGRSGGRRWYSGAARRVVRSAGVHMSVEMTVARPAAGQPGLRVLSGARFDERLRRLSGVWFPNEGRPGSLPPVLRNAAG